MTLSPEIDAKIRASFEKQSLMATLGARLLCLDRGAAEIDAPIRAGSLQQQGFAHAGLTFSIGDSAAGYAALTVLSEEQEVLTTQMHIHLLAPGSGDKLVARGKVIKPGRKLIVVQSNVYSVSEGQERHVALLTGTMMPVAL
ncbi:MAG: PaaI family thioesterase [Pseudomonadota bacterium]